jgi:hypothetical protein
MFAHSLELPAASTTIAKKVVRLLSPTDAVIPVDAKTAAGAWST